MRSETLMYDLTPAILARDVYFMVAAGWETKYQVSLLIMLLVSKGKWLVFVSADWPLKPVLF